METRGRSSWQKADSSREVDQFCTDCFVQLGMFRRETLNNIEALKAYQAGEERAAGQPVPHRMFRVRQSIDEAPYAHVEVSVDAFKMRFMCRQLPLDYSVLSPRKRKLSSSTVMRYHAGTTRKDRLAHQAFRLTGGEGRGLRTTLLEEEVAASHASRRRRK